MRMKKLCTALKDLFKKEHALTSDAVKELIDTYKIKEEKFRNLTQSDSCETNSFNFKLRVKTKTWLENEEGELIFGKGKTKLLEFIDQSGSLLKASKLMGLSYKKAWCHLQQIQNSTKEKLVLSKQGRSKESGSKLSLKAKEMMIKYQILQQDIENFANIRFNELFGKSSESKMLK